MHIIKTIKVQRLLRDLKKIKLSPADYWNFDTYAEFLSYFGQIKTIHFHNFLIGCHFTFGWMPRMLTMFPKADSNKNRKEQCRNILRLLNKVKRNDAILTKDIDSLKKSVDNSLVGTSKLLHFINPKNYPIWDTRVVKYLNLKEHRVRDIQCYEEFRMVCQKIRKEKGFRTFHRKVERLMGKQITPYRAIEFVMWKSEE